MLGAVVSIGLSAFVSREVSAALQPVCMRNCVQIGDKALPLPANTLYSNHMRPYAQPIRAPAYPKYPTVAHPSAMHRIVRAHHDPGYPQTS